MTARRVAWGLVGVSAALLALGVWFGGLAGEGSAILSVLILFLFGVFAGVGAPVVSSRPRNPIGWLFLSIAVVTGVTTAFTAIAERSGDETLARLDAWFEGWTWVPLVFVSTIFPLLLFPDGHPLTRRWRALVWLGAIGTVSFSIAMAFEPDNYPDGSPIGLDPPEVLVGVLGSGAVLVLMALLGGVISSVLRYRRAVGEERQQMRWLAFGGVLAGGAIVGSFVVGAVLDVVGVDSAPNSPSSTVLNTTIFLGVFAIPVTMGVAILRYRLYDLDLVIKKAVVFAILAVALTVVGAAIAILVGLGVVPSLSDRPELMLGVGVAYGVLAIPLYRVSRWIADRVVFGGRASPSEVVSGFTARLSETYATDDVLPRIAAVLAEATRATQTRVWVRVGREFRERAVWPEGTAPADPVPAADGSLPALPGADHVSEIRDRGELLGAISISLPANDPIDVSRERLVRDLASQAGLVLRNVRLIDELRSSRLRLVAAQDEERRRIERNIHDGAQQQLVALTVKSRLAGSLVAKDPAKAAHLLEELQSELNDALEDLRDLARGVYPPLLADQGLAAALSAQARKSPTPVTVQADGAGRFPREVEATVYFSVLEALQNVAKYADASRVTVRLMEDGGQLRFEIIDDGVGFDPTSQTFGTGLQGIADRLAAHGGGVEVESAPGAGTTIRGQLPVGPA